MSTMTSQITSFTIDYSTVYSGTDQRKYQSSASLASVRGIQRWPMNSLHKGPVTRKMFPFDDVIMDNRRLCWHAWKGSDLQDTDCCYKSPIWYAQNTQRHTRHLKLTWIPRSLFSVVKFCTERASITAVCFLIHRARRSDNWTTYYW